jgi:parallel beta-helix repeat protein
LILWLVLAGVIAFFPETRIALASEAGCIRAGGSMDPPTASSSEMIWVPDNYTTIQSAIDNASEGDTIAVRAGTYYENVVVNKSLTLTYPYSTSYFPDDWVTTIDGNRTETVILVTAPFVTIKGFIIRNSGTQTEDSGIKLENAPGCSVISNILTNNSIGVLLDNSSDCTVAANYANNNTESGIRLELCGNCSITHNQACNNGGCGFQLNDSLDCRIIFGTVANGNEVGIFLNNCSHCGAYGDDVSSNRESGVRVDYSQDCEIAGKMDNNTYGISSSYSKRCRIYGEANYDTYGIWLRDSQDCEVTSAQVRFCEYGICFERCKNCQIVGENLASFNGKYGIWLNSSEYCFIGGENNISRNKCGIRVDHSRYCQIRVNEVDNNEYGIWIGDSENCTIQATIFDEGTAQANGNTFSGIYLNSSKNCLVQGYSVGSCGYGGILLFDSKDCTIRTNMVENIGHIGTGDAEGGGCGLYQCENCTVQNNWCGNIRGSGISVKYCGDVKLFDNFVSNSLGGILLYDSDNSIVSGNDLGNNEYVGLELASSNCTVSENRIYGNSYVGIYLEGDKNTFYRNLLFNQTKHMENTWLNRTVGGYNTWDNGHEGNYWDDYSGFDLGGDRIGDTPYIIDGKDIDFFPLIGAPSEDYRPPIIGSCRITNALPSSSSVQSVNPFDVVKIQALGIDQQTGVKRMTLYYGVGGVLNYSVDMIQRDGDLFNGTYEAWICPWIFLNATNWGTNETRANITFQVEASDYSNNMGTSERTTFSTVDPRNSLNIDVTISQVNTQDELSADLDLTLDGYLPAWMRGNFSIEANNWQGNSKVDTTRLTMQPVLSNGQPALSYQGTLPARFNLIGESENYPFDAYYLNLTFRFHPSLPTCLTDPYWETVHADAFKVLEENFLKWTNVTLDVNSPHYVRPGLISTWGDPNTNAGNAIDSQNGTIGFDTDFVLVRQLNNVLPMLLLIISMTYMLGATLLGDARWNPEVKTAVYLSFFVMVAGFNFALRYLIPFRYGLTVSEVLFITLTVATAVFSIGFIISNLLYTKISEERAKMANLIIDFSAICLSVVLLAIFSVPASLLAIETLGLFFGFALRMVFIERATHRATSMNERRIEHIV